MLARDLRPCRVRFPFACRCGAWLRRGDYGAFDPVSRRMVCRDCYEKWFVKKRTGEIAVQNWRLK